MSLKIKSTVLTKNLVIYLLSILVTFFIGMMIARVPLKYVLLIIISLVFLIIIYKKIEWGIGLLIASMLYERNLFNFEISLTKVIAPPILIICVFNILRNTKKIHLNKHMDIIVLLLFLWMCLSVFYATNVELVTTSLLTYFQLIVTYLLIKSVITHENELHKLIKIVVIFSIGFIVFGLVQIIANPEALFIDMYRDANRITGTATDPNMFALGLIFMLPLSVYLFIRSSKLFIIPVILFSFVILSTYSRGGIVGLLVIFIFSIIELNRHFKKGILFSVIFTLIIVGAFMALNQGNKMYERVKTMQTLNGGSISIRMDMISTAIDMGMKNPLTGVGISNFMENSHLYGNKAHHQRASHNGYLEIFATLGFPGFILLLALIYYSLKNIRDFQHYARENNLKDAALLAKFINISLLAYMASAFFLALLPNKLFWVLLAFSNILYKNSSGQKKTEESQLN